MKAWGGLIHHRIFDVFFWFFPYPYAPCKVYEALSQNPGTLGTLKYSKIAG